MDIKRVINDISEEIRKVRSSDTTFIDHLSNILNLYKDKVYSIDNVYCVKYQIDKDDLIKHVDKSISTIKDAFNKYSSARIVDCANIITSYINDIKQFMLLEIDLVANKKWYRMRLQEKTKDYFLQEKCFIYLLSCEGR